ncbi:MAG: urease accessory protein UreD [Verrucomicrobiae bacterium]|nr:urease accessory protein UreD [Verrucomicrobiae bacterium]
MTGPLRDADLLSASPSQTGAESGAARLEVACVDGATAVTSAYSRSPMRLLVPVARGASVWAYTASFGGGCVAGDRSSLDLQLGAGTRCFVGTQSSGKVYRNPEARPSGHLTRATLGPGSLLVFAPDPVQAFADSVYLQRQVFSLEAGAGLVLLDGLTAGRVARGERWAFTRLQSHNEIVVEGRRRLLDSLRLDPADGPLGLPHRLGHCNALAVMLLIGPPVREAAAQLAAAWASRPIPGRSASLIASASPVSDGLLLRFAGRDPGEVFRECRRQLDFVPGLLGDDPWARKR